MATDAQILAATRGAQNRANIKTLLDGTVATIATASETLEGAVELATNAEARAGTDTGRAVVPSALTNVLEGLKLMSFDGRNGAGACTLTGAVVGDKVIFVSGLTAAALGNASSSFESTISVVNQIQQSSASDLSTKDYIALLLSKV